MPKIEFAVVGGFGDSGTKNNAGGLASENLPEDFGSRFVLFSDKENRTRDTGGFMSTVKMITSDTARAQTILNNLGMSNGDAPINGIAQTIYKNGIGRILGHSFGGAAVVKTSGLLAERDMPLSVVISESSPYSPQSIIKSRASGAKKLLITDKVMEKANLAWDLEYAIEVSLQKGTKIIVVRRVGDATVQEEEQLYTRLKNSQEILSDVPPELHGNLILMSIKLDPEKAQHYSIETTRTLIRNRVSDMFQIKGTTNLTKFNKSFNVAFTAFYPKYIDNSHHWPLEDFIIEEEYTGSEYTFKSVSNTKGCNFKERALAEFKGVTNKQQKYNASAAFLMNSTYAPARVEDKFECSKGQINGFYIEKLVTKITEQLKKDGFKVKDGAKNISSAEWGREWEKAVGISSEQSANHGLAQASAPAHPDSSVSDIGVDPPVYSRALPPGHSSGNSL